MPKFNGCLSEHPGETGEERENAKEVVQATFCAVGTRSAAQQTKLARLVARIFKVM
jgi:hypothetical protein